jgi:MarR family transcriptional regulator, organic hydroperoxide resistance regulator
MSELSSPPESPVVLPETPARPARRRPRLRPPRRSALPAEAAEAAEAASMLHHWREAVPDDRFAHLVKDAARSFQRSLQKRLFTHDVPFGHWTFLRVLWEHDGLTQKQLSDEVGVMEPSTFAAVKAMESRGWVERRQRPDNKKNVHVFLTDAGRALKAVLVPLAETVNGLGIHGLSDADLAVAKRVLLVIITQLAADVSAGTATDEP